MKQIELDDDHLQFDQFGFSAYLADEIGEVEQTVEETEEKPVREVGSNEPALYSYLQNIGKTSLIKANDEIELGRAIACGDNGALSKLVVSNLRLVVSIAKRFRNQGMDLEDMIQEGNLGLIHAARKFDPSMGNRFSTYATWWIRQAIMRAIANKGRSIRIPVHVRSQISKLKRFAKSYHQNYGRFPNELEIAQELQISADEVNRLVSNSGQVISLDEQLPGNDKETVGSFVEDHYAALPESEAEQAMLRRCIDKLTRYLSPLEKTAISYLYGLEGDGTYDSKMVAAKLQIDIPELRRIQKRSLKKMRRHLYNKTIDDFIS